MTAAAVRSIDRKRLAQLLGMLGSNYEGEVANAGRLADRLVRDAGLTWEQVLRPAEKAKASPDIRFDVGAAIALCQQNFDRLNPWERKFYTSLPWPRRPLSPKQMAVLDGIVRGITAGTTTAAPKRRRKRRRAA